MADRSPEEEAEYLNDALEAAPQIQRSVNGMGKEEFVGDEQTIDADLGNLKVIDEAGKLTSTEPRPRATSATRRATVANTPSAPQPTLVTETRAGPHQWNETFFGRHTGYLNASITASVICRVLASPPRSAVRGPSSRTVSVAVRTASASCW